MLKKSLLRIALVLSVFLFFYENSKAQDVPEKPVPPRLVNDFANILSQQEKSLLETKLVAFNDSTSNQIVIVTVNDFGGYDKAEYSTALGEKWGVGQKGKNNGIIILIKPSGKQGQRKAHIAVGYGLEPLVPDITAKRIVQNEMIPEFEKGNYYEGLNKATNVIIGLVKGEFTAEKYQKKKASGGMIFSFIFPIFILLLIFFIAGRKRNSSTLGGSGLPWLAALMLMGGGNRSSGSWGDFSGGGGGGGFGGFGGGSFGGGGAGGSW
jgi:uncharacterized protein